MCMDGCINQGSPFTSACTPPPHAPPTHTHKHTRANAYVHAHTREHTRTHRRTHIHIHIDLHRQYPASGLAEASVAGLLALRENDRV